MDHLLFHGFLLPVVDALPPEVMGIRGVIGGDYAPSLARGGAFVVGGVARRLRMTRPSAEVTKVGSGSSLTSNF